jgi:hypothetical protein
MTRLRRQRNPNKRRTAREIYVGSVLSPDYVRACQWIEGHTPPSTLFLTDYWGMYLSWRRGESFWLPDSEPQNDLHPQTERISLLLAGKIKPDPPDMQIVRVDSGPQDASLPVLWQGASGLRVVRLYPPQ